jgi:hypothetical protein
MCVDIPPCANPTCKADEWCDHSRSTDCATDNCCAKICNDPAGCLATQVCVLDPADAGTAYTGTCQP